jgi:formylglycine-generating enzyme required for sulfatase activity
MCETPLVRSVCPACGIPVKDNWKICPECSSRLICQACGRRLPSGSSECALCGEGEAAAPESKDLRIEPVTGIELIRVPAGSFLMGDLFDVGWDNEAPVHEVRIEAFYLGKYAVTQGQWEKLMAANPSMFPRGDMCPVEQVTWADVNEFIQRVNRLTSGKHPFRLPSEAEWEYAARSGGRKELYAGGNDIDRVAWYADNSEGSTQPVGLKAPNGLGLYDMSGNVWEWCQDVYTADISAGPERDRHSRKSPIPERVIRGGSWNLDDWSSRCSRRFGFPEDYFGAGLGFRLALTV